MTEPAVASSDASNIAIEIKRDGNEYVINGDKWWITGAGSTNCELIILMGKTDPTAPLYRQQSQIIVPMSTPGITLVRALEAFGHKDAPKGHMEIQFRNVRVPLTNVLLGEGRGFEISQARLGPGRIHHCMRQIGQAERALSLMCRRSLERVVFKNKLMKSDVVLQNIAKSRAEIDQARLLLWQAADFMDLYGNKDDKTRRLLSLVKAIVPRMTQEVVDRAIQIHGGLGVSQDTFLSSAWIGSRALRIADGPDEVHLRTAGLLELKLQQGSNLFSLGTYHPDK
eukprot:TRINITY_DN7234_c2_g1_i2.p1 TRINITY_DN7234_c2_g1~~TRINITY_DN7234_c2_g1_i2.p1  ORF type:complete len:283 (-),score=55.84 TRINITY_DN7234_c2_g1_i2:145-993(-)